MLGSGFSVASGRRPLASCSEAALAQDAPDAGARVAEAITVEGRSSDGGPLPSAGAFAWAVRLASGVVFGASFWTDPETVRRLLEFMAAMPDMVESTFVPLDRGGLLASGQTVGI